MGEFVFIEEEKYSEKSGIGMYRSKEPIPINHPFVGGGYISNKKWPLNEECTMQCTAYDINNYLNVFRLCLCIS